MGKFFSVALLLLLTPAAGALEPALVAQSPIVQLDGALCCDGFGTHSAMAADGSFVVFWYNEDRIKARRFSAAGVPAAAEIKHDLQAVFALAGAPDGGFLAFGSSSEGLGVWGFDAAGKGAPVVAPGVLPANSWRWAIVREVSGNFYVLVAAGSSPNWELQLHHFDSAGKAIGPVRSIPVGQLGFAPRAIAVSATADGEVQVIFEHVFIGGLTGDGVGIHRQRYAASGEAIGGIEPVLVGDTGDTRFSAAPDGRIVASFHTYEGFIGLGGIVADPRGPVGPRLQLWREKGGWAVESAPALLGSGDIVAATDGIIYDQWATILLTRTRPDGQSAGPRLQLMPSTPGTDFLHPDIASSGDRLVVLWYPRGFSPHSVGPIAFQIFDAPLFADSFETGGTGNWTVVQ